MSSGIVEILARQESRQALLCHPFFQHVRDTAITRADAGTFLGQWWHPLHYFPVFLSRTIAVLPRQDTKTEVSKILYQELGEGNPQLAHERVFVDTMTAVGFTESALTQTPPLPETRRLIEGYAQASEQPMEALGFLYGTEVADLTMVSGIGHAVRSSQVTRHPAGQVGSRNICRIHQRFPQHPDDAVARRQHPADPPASLAGGGDHPGRRGVDHRRHATRLGIKKISGHRLITR